MSFESATRELVRDGQTATLPTQDATVLEALLRSEGRVVSKREITAILWPESQFGEFDLAINNIVSKLRRALGEDGREVHCIKTVHKAGYRMICPVAVEEEFVLARSRPFPQVPESGTQADSPTPPLARTTRPKAKVFRITFLAFLLLLVILGGSLWGWFRFHHTPSPKDSVKVFGILPFTVVGADSPLTGETLRGQIADSIAEIPGVQVRAAHSLTLEMARDDQALHRAAQQLSLDYLLTGTIRLTESSYECDMELIHGPDSSHLKSFHYEGPRIGLSAIPDQLENVLFALISPSRTGTHVLPADLNSDNTQKAYALAFQAAESLTERSTSSVDRAIALYHQAIQLDPNYAKAYSGLAESEAIAADLGVGNEVAAHFEAARSAALNALARNPDNAQAHSVLGLVLLQKDWKFSAAEQQLRAALRLNPGLAANHTKLAMLLTDRGNFKEAEQEVDLAHTLDPDWPVVYGMGLYVHLMGRKYPQAIADGKAIVSMRPDWSRGHNQLGWAYWYGGDHTKAVQEWILAARLAHNTQLADWETRGLAILDTQGVQAYAKAKLRDFSPLGAHDDFVPAEWAAFTGNADATLAALNLMVKQRDPECLKIASNPAYDFLRADARFKQLLRNIDQKINGSI